MTKKFPKIKLYICLIAVIISSIMPLKALAVSSDFYSSNDILFYDPNATNNCSSSNIDTGPGGNSSSGVWNSGLKPPYILEQFAIETLKDVAAKKGVDPTNAVTKEHVVALIAFMFGEGGDINNGDLFNPLNTGINASDLIDGAHRNDGVQSFKSFDAGVEATARTMAGSYQSRLTYILTQKDSTAQEFMHTLTYYKEYNGNQFWAQESVDNPTGYYNQRISLVQQVNSHYADIAGLVLGTPAKEQLENLTNKSLLVYSSSTDTSSKTDSGNSSNDSGCPTDTGVISNNIVQTAINLSWPEKHNPPLTPKPEYAAAILKYNPGGMASFDGADCGAFVSTVMRASGVDVNYPSLGTSSQLDYAKQHSDKYDVLDAITSTADLQPGDVLVTSHHTIIFIGSQPNGHNVASASLGDRMPNLGNATLTDSVGNPYARIRVKQ